MNIDDNDRKLFKLLLQQKCLTLNLIIKFLSPEALKLPAGKRPKLYFRLYHLTRGGYLKKQIIEGHEVYLLTNAGLDAVRDLNNTNIPLSSLSDLETVTHDLITSNIRHYLEFHGATDWVSDKELRMHTDKLPYVPDGACLFGNNTVFIEVELTRKSRDRYEKIAAIYTAPRGPDKVIYFYMDDSVVGPLMEFTREHERVGFFKYQDEMDSLHSLSGVCASKDITLGRFLGLLQA